MRTDLQAALGDAWFLAKVIKQDTAVVRIGDKYHVVILWRNGNEV